jgi:quercetin dioxygenase-like cupin family protein
MNRFGRFVFPLLLILSGSCRTPAAGTLPAKEDVPVFQEPMHRLVFQSPLVRVLDVRVPAGDTTAYHIHGNRLVGIAVEDARTWAQLRGAPPGQIKAAPPTPSVFDNWSQALPYDHRVADADTVPLHYVVAEWLARSGPEAPALPDGPNRHLVKEGATCRVYQITLAPGEATEPHTHVAPGLTVQGNGGVLSDDGATRARGGDGAGEWSWHEAQYRHVLRNDGPTRLIVYEIEWR